jgi:ABC transport system ATP-binding/permease protein
LGFLALVQAMLEVLNVSQIITPPKGESLTVLNQIHFGVPSGHLMGVIGAPGSGKTSLISLLSGCQHSTEGTILFQGKDTAVNPPHANSIGHVPAGDDCLNELLSVRETIMSALMLRVGGQTPEERIGKASHILVGVGLETVAAQRVGLLSLPQKRRLKLALALVSDAALILCDEFTDGLDVKSEQELTALLKFVVLDQPGRVVIHATQTLGNINSYDTVVILHEGHVCFHGPARAVAHYFSITTVEELYPRLAKRPAERWGDSWSRHRESYYEAFKLGDLGKSLAERPEEAADDTEGLAMTETLTTKDKPAEEVVYAAAPALPSFLTQASHLIQRRWTLLRRNQQEWTQHLILLILSPVLAMLLLAPNTVFLSSLKHEVVAPEDLWPAAYTCSMAIFIQILLILIMSVRNGAREIAGERPLFERERLSGLRTSAYLMGKLGFLIPIVLAQSLTLGLFLAITGGSLPGNGIARLLLLMLTGIAFTSICLGLSARSSSAARAQNHAWMLLVINVLLCGALLGFPRLLGGVLQPLITAYYGWSGSVDTLQNTVVFEPMTKLVRTWFASPSGAMIALLSHALLGMALTISGLRSRPARLLRTVDGL